MNINLQSITPRYTTTKNNLYICPFFYLILLYMCSRDNCKFIEIIEIYDGVKVIIHYDENRVPILFQYWDSNNHLTFEPAF